MLREQRENKGMTTIELAAKSGVCRDLINKIELHGYRKCKPVTWVKLANALEVEVEKIKN
jgi:ribosome-binding protein aMBF1 (putative translation factor)